MDYEEVEPHPFVGNDLGGLRAVSEDAQRNIDQIAYTLLYKNVIAVLTVP